MMKQKSINFFSIFLLLGALTLTGCASREQAVNFKIHSEPEGAYIVYKQDNSPWIYLGVTPLDIIETISRKQLDDDHTITLRAMRCGYLDQKKEWRGDEVEREVGKKGMLFWTPRLIKDTP
ncbi:MAG: hypothetical protein D6B25_17260 [Desulfobulbaceae bacterium]|nr:MAG: hypothetical protein D6B25_17260 [Desulfobulbaceae bacterium]